MLGRDRVKILKEGYQSRIGGLSLPVGHFNVGVQRIDSLDEYLAKMVGHDRLAHIEPHQMGPGLVGIIHHRQPDYGQDPPMQIITAIHMAAIFNKFKQPSPQRRLIGAVEQALDMHVYIVGERIESRQGWDHITFQRQPRHQK